MSGTAGSVGRRGRGRGPGRTGAAAIGIAAALASAGIAGAAAGGLRAGPGAAAGTVLPASLGGLVSAERIVLFAEADLETAGWAESLRLPVARAVEDPAVADLLAAIGISRAGGVTAADLAARAGVLLAGIRRVEALVAEADAADAGSGPLLALSIEAREGSDAARALEALVSRKAKGPVADGSVAAFERGRHGGRDACGGAASVARRGTAWIMSPTPDALARALDSGSGGAGAALEWDPAYRGVADAIPTWNSGWLRAFVRPSRLAETVASAGGPAADRRRDRRNRLLGALGLARADAALGLASSIESGRSVVEAHATGAEAGVFGRSTRGATPLESLLRLAPPSSVLLASARLDADAVLAIAGDCEEGARHRPDLGIDLRTEVLPHLGGECLLALGVERLVPPTPQGLFAATVRDEAGLRAALARAAEHLSSRAEWLEEEHRGVTIVSVEPEDGGGLARSSFAVAEGILLAGTTPATVRGALDRLLDASTAGGAGALEADLVLVPRADVAAIVRIDAAQIFRWLCDRASERVGAGAGGAEAAEGFAGGMGALFAWRALGEGTVHAALRSPLGPEALLWFGAAALVTDEARHPAAQAAAGGATGPGRSGR